MFWWGEIKTWRWKIKKIENKKEPISIFTIKRNHHFFPNIIIFFIWKKIIISHRKSANLIPKINYIIKVKHLLICSIFQNGSSNLRWSNFLILKEFFKKLFDFFDEIDEIFLINKMKKTIILKFLNSNFSQFLDRDDIHSLFQK